MKEENEMDTVDADRSVSEDDESDSSDSGSGSESSSSSDWEQKVVSKITYHLSIDKAVSLQKHYICHMCGSTSNDHIATASSDFVSSVYDLNELKNIRTLEGHTKEVTNIRFNPSDPNQLVTSSTDGTIRFWDVRKPGKSVLTFKDDTAQSGCLKSFLSFDISKSGHFMCAGTELFEGDAFLVFADARSAKVLGGYWESHSDDITQVEFHPLLSDCVASGSSDGLINIYDLKCENEDDALINSLNTESTVDKLSWSMLDGKQKGICCILDTMDVQVWDQDNASPSWTYTRKHIAKATGWKADDSYMVNVHQNNTGDFILLSGTTIKNSERLAILQAKGKELLLESELPSNKQRVRCSWYSNKNDSIVAAGEGGIISIWRPGPGEQSPQNKSSKVLSKLTPARRKPY